MAEINFIGRVDEPNITRLIKNVESLIANGEIAININIYTHGGAIQQGIAGYEALAQYGDKLTMNNLKNTDSAGIVLFCAAQNRRCNDNATFLLHSTYNPKIDTQNINPLELQEHKKVTDLINRMQAGIIGGTIGLSSDVILNMINTGCTITAQNALACNLVQSINPTLVKPAIGGIDIHDI